jgi:hypothetical protein
MYRSLRSEVREVIWLIAIIAGLSGLSVGLAVGLAVALDRWQHLAAVTGHAS